MKCRLPLGDTNPQRSGYRSLSCTTCPRQPPRSEHTTAAEQSQRRLAEAITRRKQALEVAKLARKQATRRGVL